MSKILIGSQYFFSCYKDFESKDIDELEIIETENFKYSRQLTGRGKCLFQLRKQNNKEEYIKYALSSKVPMVVGKFLVPEFCKEIGFTIEELPRMQPLIDALDDKHKYEKIIYDSYIENGSFSLSDQQREKAYESYRKSRGE